MAKLYMINWKRSDYVRLSKAVAKFNRINATIPTRYRMPYKDYTSLKNSITTRAELNRIINSLNRISEEGMTDIVTLEGGEKITKWEKKEINLSLRIAKANLTREMKPYLEAVEGSGGFSKAQMGNSEYRALKRTYESLENPFTRSGGDFRRIKRRIESLGVSDLEMKRAIVFRENYKKALKDRFSNLENYDKLLKKLNSFSNPISFYNFVKRDDFTIDFPFMYDLASEQAFFNQYIQRLGIKLDD